jgi:hypothetical protein
LFGAPQDAEESDDTASARQSAPARRAPEPKPAAAPPRTVQVATTVEPKLEPKPAAPRTVQVATTAEPKLEPKLALEPRFASEPRLASAAQPTPAQIVLAAAPAENVPLPRSRPIYQIASADSRPVSLPPRRHPEAGEAVPPTANDVVTSRGFWDGTEPPRPPADIPGAGIDDARRDLAVGLVAAGNRETTASAGPFARPDRVPAELALAYAVQADANLAARPTPRPTSISAIVTRKPGGTVAVKPSETIARSRAADPLDDPWMRVLTLVASVQNSMTVTRVGDPDYTRLVEYMQKPKSAVLMTFSHDPHLGMTDKAFSGSAVVFQATVTFGDQRTAALQ